jgi:hypothetical protein
MYIKRFRCYVYTVVQTTSMKERRGLNMSFLLGLLMIMSDTLSLNKYEDRQLCSVRWRIPQNKRTQRGSSKTSVG